MDTTLPATDTPDQRSGVSRRTIVAGAAWAVPAIVAVTATPAFAASGPTVTATTPNMRIPAAGTTVVTAVVRNALGKPLAGQAVSFTGPSGTSFSPSSATTNSSGAATSTLTTTDTWTTPGSTITATVVSNGLTGTAPLTVVGANAYLVGANSAAAAPGGTTLTAATQLKLVFPSPITMMASLSPNSCFALLQDGSVWGIGDNGFGQLADGTTTTRNTWAKIADLSNVVQITGVGNRTVLALLADGTVKGWGNNSARQLSDGTTTDRYTPVTVTGLGSVGIQQLIGGIATAYALLTDGTIRGWGYNYHGEIGNGTTDGGGGGSSPATVSGITTATQIAAASGSGYALLADGTVRSWGMNTSGQLGSGTTTDSTVPVTVPGITTATHITAGTNAVAVRLTDGTIRTWGRGYSGELGNGTTPAYSSTPVTVTGITTATRVTMAGVSAYAQLADGTIRSWGGNYYGQLGNGTTTDQTTPVTLPGATNISTITPAVYSGGTLLIRSTSSAAATVTATAPGLQITAGSSVVVTAVVRNALGKPLAGQAVSFTGPSGTSFSPSSATTNSSGAATSTLTTTDTWTTPGSTITATVVSNGLTGTAPLTVVGANAYLVGANSAAAAPGGTTLTAATQLKLVFPSPITMMASLSPNSCFALLQDGSVWGIGDNGFGQLADGTTTTRNTWAKIADLSNVVQITGVGNRTVLALLADGTVKGWGNNSARQLSDGTTTDRYTPVTVTGLGSVGIQQLIGGIATAYALLTDGTIRGWGYNYHGEIGNGTTDGGGGGSSPATVSGITTATQIAAASGSGYALLADGTVRSWGMNTSGQLGSGTTTDSTVPVTVPGITTATHITAGTNAVAVRLTDGTIRTWGRGYSGELGNGTTPAYSSTPVTVTGITTATRVTMAGVSAYAQLADGTIRSWGGNYYGQLGNGTTTDQTTPVTLPGATNISTITPAVYSGGTLLIR